MQTTFEQVLQDAQALSLEDQRLLVELIEPPKTLAELAAEQGVKPFVFSEARQTSTFWPAGENVDEFVATIREWRRDTKAE